MDSPAPSPPGATPERDGRRTPGNPLGRQLLVAIVLFSLAASLVSTAVQLAADYRGEVHALEERLEQLRTSYAQSVAQSLWSLDEAPLRIQLEGMTTLPDIVRAEVDSTLGTHYEAGAAPRTERGVVRSIPLYHGETLLGTLRVSATLEDIHARLRARVLVILATHAAQTFLIALFVLFVVQRRVTQHLATMAAYTRGLNPAHLDAPLVLRREAPGPSGRDELDEVCSAINEMRESLRQELGERQRSEAANALLAEAGEVLLSSLEAEQVLPRVASLCVGALADWCVIDLVEDGEVRRVGGAHGDAAKRPLLDELRRRYPPGPGSAAPSARVMRQGEPVLEPQLSEDRLRALCADEEHLRLVQALGSQSLLVVPLVARGHVVGSISLVSATPERYGPAELALARELARRAAIAIDNARLYLHAERAIRLREVFLSVAAHELRTPLLPLQLRLQSLLRRGRSGAPLEPARVLEEVAAAERQTKQLGLLVDQLLDVSLLSAGHALELRRRRVDLGELVAGVLEELRPQVEASGSEVRRELGGPAVGWWDARRVEQVVTGLVRNALKFGEGRPIDVRVTPRDGAVVLVVKDNGIGMPEGERVRLFERFGRGVPVRHYGGLGLGLYLTRRLVEAHGGSISVESRPGEGSTFTVALPVGEAPGAAEGPGAVG
ncbi:signal transduction histidine kinase [Archangium gephyra]|uniref:histidine kinase n=1 Tax=Archangium gephyra TaxID=48 RepID=A0AAC8TAI7_9BACT|nr:HAMP domain-containing histidine kinase [Archangium gephyra]AKI98796.1 Sensory box histidine kinase [Archangium gephyra]REG30716.1 signal transduction histidine kinase [Archangium gephyra]